MSRSTYSITALAAVSIVLLRIGIGAHFLAEGWTKLANPKPFSGPFFSNAKGPFAPLYKSLVWDSDGLFRLDLEGSLEEWSAFRDQAASHYNFDDKQQKAAETTYKRFSDRLKQFLASKSDTVAEYTLWLERRDRNAADKSRELASLQKHDARIASETRKLWAELVPPIDQLWKDYEQDINAISTEEQWTRHGRLALGRPGSTPTDSESMDKIIPWFHIAIGICLILGLLTRPAAILAGLFLASVCLSQWPLSPGAIPIYYQAIEMLAVFALAAIGAGRFLGIDGLIGSLRGANPKPATVAAPARTRAAAT